MIRFILILASFSMLLLSIDMKTQNLESKGNLKYAYLDVSKSVPKKLIEDGLSYLKKYNDSFDLKIIPFAKTLSKKQFSYSEDLDLKEIQENFKESDLNKTNFDSVLQNYIDNSVVITDGFFHSIINESLIETKKADVFIPSDNYVKALKINSFFAPKFVEANTNYSVMVDIVNDSEEDRSGEIKVYRNNEVIFSDIVNVSKKDKFFKKIEEESLIKDDVLYTIELNTNDISYRRNVRVSKKKSKKILIVSRILKEARPLERLIKLTGYKIESILNSELKEGLDLSVYDLVILNNVHKNELKKQTPKEIKSYVANGGKFFMLGGNKSFGLGNYKGSEIEEILPVTLLNPKRKQERINLAVQLLIDKSQSMSGNQKIDYAKLAAREVIRNLKDEDYFGLIGFEEKYFIARRMAKLQGSRELAIKRVGLLFASGGTELLPAMSRASVELSRARSTKKHLIILTDGKLPDGKFNRSYYLQLVSDLRLSGVTVSVFVIGNVNDSLLEEMARLGKGTYYKTGNAGNLPRLFIEDVKKNGREQTKQEKGPYKVIGMQADRFNYFNYPKLFGFVETKLKSNAKLSLELRTKEKKQPLLAFYDYKKGKTAAFTSDLNSRWSKLWFNWDDLFRFIKEVFRELELESNVNSKNLDFDYNFLFSRGASKLKLNIFSNYNINDLKFRVYDKENKLISHSIKDNGFGNVDLEFSVINKGVHRFELQYEGELITSYFDVEKKANEDVVGLGVNRRVLNLLNSKFKKIVDVKNKIAKSTKTKIEIDFYYLLIALLVLVFEMFYRKKISDK